MAPLHRDRQTRLLYAQLAIYGYFLYGFNASIPLLGTELGVSRAVAGLHGTAFACGTVVAGLTGAGLSARFGRRRVLWAGLGGLCAGVVLLVGATALGFTLLAAAVAGLAGSLVVNTVTAALSDHAGRWAPAALNEANALAAGLGLVAPLMLGVGAATVVGWRLGPALLLPLVAGLALSMRGVAVAEAPARPTSGGAAQARAGRRLGGRYWAAWAVLLVLVGCEFAMTIWSSEVLRQRTGLEAGAAATGVTAIVLGMAVGRWWGARLTLRVPVDPLLLAAIALGVAGFALFWSATAPVPAFAGLLLTGLGLSVHFPLAMTRAVAASGGRPDLATARAALGVGLAIGTGPFVLGALADVVGPHRAVLVVPVLLALAAAGIVGSRGVGARPV